MKFSTVLAIFVLSTLEAYRVCASPLELDSQSLERRKNYEYCCVTTVTYTQRQSKFVAYPATGLIAVLERSDDCTMLALQNGTPPSQGGCAGWKFEISGCIAAKSGVKAAAAFVEAASVCLPVG
ncbi:hypothetical protein E4U40_005409 [Claviceps sp. LM458 group G5]|nr:hypothetical protein E4U40_005409 [Claviceps sp. LM458 group G5]